jgi:transposase
MGYSIDFRKKLLEYLGKGHTMREAREVFGVGLDTVNRWVQMFKRTGGLKDKAPLRPFKKLDPEKLEAYLEVHPDAYLGEIGEAFGCNESSVRKAFQRLRITRKKKPKGSVSKGRNK